jgi:hypothetical protein
MNNPKYPARTSWSVRKKAQGGGVWGVKGINRWTEPGVRMKKLGAAFKECGLKGACNFRSRVNLG